MAQAVADVFAIHEAEDRAKVETLVREQKLRMLDLTVMPPLHESW